MLLLRIFCWTHFKFDASSTNRLEVQPSPCGKGIEGNRVLLRTWTSFSSFWRIIMHLYRQSV